jgi:hypothetical protein
MIGIANEMLLYLSYSSRDFSKICATKQTLSRIRSHLGTEKYSEEQMAEWLTRLGCNQIRGRVVLPAIIVDRNKRVFDEFTFVKLYMSPFVQKEIERKLGMENIYTSEGCLVPRALKIFLKKKKAYVETQRCVLPSVWSYEPAYAEDVSPRVADTIGRIIGNQIPFRESRGRIVSALPRSVED